MKGFHFRLEALLPLRESSKEKALLAYVEALRKRVEADEVLVEAKERLSEYEDKLVDQTSESFSVGERQHWMGVIDNGRSTLTKMEVIVEQLRGEESKKLVVLLEAKRDLDVLLKLKEKKKKHFTWEVQRKEEQELEDMISGRYRV